ncbi:uncharacterized protein KY384_006570 [Bacidia gigantensis]|uniref:uncharacterized protein n=1 Tax=Bacidia gigantensis TaxID=2732470 RepID=UPI001D04A277|nr:uncharacterized protein KY384_006570 [Bacidia gigantensis]KAG8528881.1 hypothetical protein KY384_006570 [Bacidia gigantensis]
MPVQNFSDFEQRAQDPSHKATGTAEEQKHPQKSDSEQHVGRNPHPDFSKVQASRPDWNEDSKFHFTKTRNPTWSLGDGANDNGESLQHKHVEIDPYEEGRPAVFNYKLLISGIIPRPIGFVSTCSADGTSTNLAPFSYTQVINHDPPLFIIGFAGGFSNAKDTLRNLSSQKECTINIISEHYIEAANACSIDCPYGVSEWSLSGLTPAPSAIVKPSRVKEAVFTVEATLVSTQEFESKATKGKKTGVLAIVEGVRFWVREDATNEERNLIDPGVLRPMSRLGGIMYGRTVEGVEIPRPVFKEKEKAGETGGLVKGKAEGQ